MRRKIIGLLLALLPVLSIYRLPGIDFPMGMATMFFIIIPLVILDHKKSGRKQIVEKYGFFCIYAVLVTILFRGISNDVIGFLLNSICILFLLRGGSYLESFIKSYVYLAVAFSVFLVFQYASLLLFSTPINGIISFLPTNNGEEMTSLDVRDYVSVARISSVFTEPSHFALYCLPPVALLLWDFVSVKFRILFLAIISLAILLSTSGNGLVLLAILFSLYFLNRLRGRRAFLAFFVGVALLFVGYKASERIESVQYTIEALSQANGGEDSKSYYRVKRGFLVYGDMPFYAQIVGVGYRNSESFLLANKGEVVTKYRVGDVVFDYYNSVAAILIYFGLIGFILMAIFITSVWRLSKHYGEKALIAVMLISCISASIFNSDTWFIYIVLMAAISHGYLRINGNNGENRYKQTA